MKNILIKKINLISMSSKRPLIVENIDVLVVDGKISKIGKNLKKTKEIKIIDGTSKYLIPGLINAHTHIPMALFKEIVDGETLQA
jgi:5-methylthioadenosine/S-adenosylhomocysteine deaminase